MNYVADRSDLGLPVLPDVSGVHKCVGGWLREDAEGRPVPCLRCKPHLVVSHLPDGSLAWEVRDGRS